MKIQKIIEKTLNEALDSDHDGKFEELKQSTITIAKEIARRTGGKFVDGIIGGGVGVQLHIEGYDKITVSLEASMKLMRDYGMRVSISYAIVGEFPGRNSGLYVDIKPANFKKIAPLVSDFLTKQLERLNDGNHACGKLAGQLGSLK